MCGVPGCGGLRTLCTQAHFLPSARNVDFLPALCQPEPGLRPCLPGGHRLSRGSLGRQDFGTPLRRRHRRVLLLFMQLLQRQNSSRPILCTAPLLGETLPNFGPARFSGAPLIFERYPSRRSCRKYAGAVYPQTQALLHVVLVRTVALAKVVPTCALNDVTCEYLLLGAGRRLATSRSIDHHAVLCPEAIEGREGNLPRSQLIRDREQDAVLLQERFELWHVASSKLGHHLPGTL